MTLYIRSEGSNLEDSKSTLRTWRLARPDRILTNNAESTSAIKNLTVLETSDCFNENQRTEFPFEEKDSGDKKPNDTTYLVDDYDVYIEKLYTQAQAFIAGDMIEWANLAFGQMRILILNLPPSLPSIQKMLRLAIELSHKLEANERNQEIIVNRFREVLYLAERVGVTAVREQIYLNILVSDAYKAMLRGESKKTGLNIRIVAYLSEAHWLAYKFNHKDRLLEIYRKIDKAEARFIASMIPPSTLLDRLTTAFKTHNYDINASFTMVERLISLMVAHKEYEYVREIYREGLVEKCLADKNGAPYVCPSLKMLNALNEIVLNQGQYYEVKSHRSHGRRGSELIFNRITDNRKKELIECPIPLPHLPQWSQFRKRLEEIRSNALKSNSQQFFEEGYVASLMESLNNSLSAVVADILAFSVKLLGDPPCIFVVMGLGSLSRGEATPYSDIEYGFLLYDETKREDPYWNALCSCFEFFILCAGERAGFHVDNQGTPKTPLLRGTIDQILEIITFQKLDTNSVGMVFSLLRPSYLFGFPENPAKSLFDQYILKINSIFSDKNFSAKYVAKIFLKDHVSFLKRWTLPDERSGEVEIKTQFLQPILFILTDITILLGIFSSTTSGSVATIVETLSHVTPDSWSYPFFSLEFAQSIVKIYHYLCGLRLVVQNSYKEQFYGDLVSISSPKTTANGMPYVVLSREQVYWMDMAYDMILKPLHQLLRQVSAEKLKQVKPIDPILDEIQEYITKKNNEPQLKHLIKDTVSTIVFRNSPFTTHTHIYLKLSPDLRLFYLAKLTQHAFLFESKIKELVEKLRMLG